MARIPAGVEKHKGKWGITYSYRGIPILRGSGRYSTRYEFFVGRYKVRASTLVEAVEQIEYALYYQSLVGTIERISEEYKK